MSHVKHTVYNSSMNITNDTSKLIQNSSNPGWTSANNSTDDWGEGDDTISPLDAVLICCGISGILGNAVCFLVLITHSPLRKKLHNLFLINHTLVDFVVCNLIIADTVSHIPATNALVCFWWRKPCVFTGLYVSSAYNIVALAIERYMEVVRPIAHRNYVTRPRVIFLLVALWVFGPTLRMITVLPPWSYVDGQCYDDPSFSHILRSFLGCVTFLMEFVVPLLTIVLCYGMMTVSLKKRVRPGTNTVTSASDIMSRAQRNVSITLVLVTTCFVLCTLLRQILLLLDSTGVYPINYQYPFYSGTELVAYSSCAIYPYICFHRHTEFKRGLRALFHFKGIPRTDVSTVDVEKSRTAEKKSDKFGPTDVTQL